MGKYMEILRLHGQGISGRSIAASCGVSRNTVSKVVSRAEELGLEWPLRTGITEQKLSAMLFTEESMPETRRQPNFEHIHRELAKSGVTLSLLWNEYQESCGLSGEIPFMYTQFCKYYREWAGKTQATTHIHHKPGEKLEVDWAGTTMALRDNITGGDIPVYIFVSVLPCSGYAYVEEFLSQDQESWIAAHVNAYRYFGGVTRIQVPDNLK